MMHVILKCEEPLNLYLILRSVLGYVCVAEALPAESKLESVYTTMTTKKKT